MTLDEELTCSKFNVLAFAYVGKNAYAAVQLDTSWQDFFKIVTNRCRQFSDVITAISKSQKMSGSWNFHARNCVLLAAKMVKYRKTCRVTVLNALLGA